MMSVNVDFKSFTQLSFNNWALIEFAALCMWYCNAPEMILLYIL